LDVVKRRLADVEEHGVDAELRRHDDPSGMPRRDRRAARGREALSAGSQLDEIAVPALDGRNAGVDVLPAADHDLVREAVGARLRRPAAEVAVPGEPRTALVVDRHDPVRPGALGRRSRFGGRTARRDHGGHRIRRPGARDQGGSSMRSIAIAFTAALVAAALAAPQAFAMPDRGRSSERAPT
jgi:hypothetical protein